MKTFIKYLTVVAVIGLVIVGGCFMEQFWPTNQVSPVVVSYNEKDPNNYKLPITWLGKVKRLSQETEKTYLDRQTYLKAELAIDEGTHAMAKNELDVIIKIATEQFQTYIGTPKQPGMLWAGIYTLLGGGGTAAALRNMWYTQKEYDAGIEKAINGNKETSTT